MDVKQAKIEKKKANTIPWFLKTDNDIIILLNLMLRTFELFDGKEEPAKALEYMKILRNYKI